MPCGKMYQKYNKKKGSWEKYKIMKDGKVKIMDVKTKEPKKPFKGVMKNNPYK